MAYDDEGYEAPIEEEQPVQEAIPEQATSEDVMPLPDDEASQAGARDWVKELLDYTRSMFGINEEAVPTEHEPAGSPVQVRGEEPTEEHEPAGPPEQARPQSAQASMFGDVAGAIGGAVKQGWEALNTKPEGPDPVERMKAYVMREGAMPQDESKQRQAQTAANADPTTPLTKSDINKQALKAAFDESPEKGAAMLQNYGKNQAIYINLAAAALNSGNKEDATKLFNESHTFVPDGQHATAIPTTTGVVMAVNDSASGQTQSIPLTDNQFRELLMKTPGDFDHLTERGLTNMLADVARSPGVPAQGQAAGAPNPLEQKVRGDVTAAAGVRTAQAPGGAAPPAAAQSTARPGDQPRGPQQRGGQTQQLSLEQRAQKMFPWANQSDMRRRAVEQLRASDAKAARGSEATTRRLDISQAEHERKLQQGGQRIEQSGQRLGQGERRLNMQATRYDQIAADKAADRVGRMDVASQRDATAKHDTKLRMGEPLTPDEQALDDQIRERARVGTTRPGGAPAATPVAPAGGSTTQGAGPGEWRTNKRTGEERWFSTP